MGGENFRVYLVKGAGAGRELADRSLACCKRAARCRPLADPLQTLVT